MKRIRFSEEQIIGILKELPGRAGREGAVPQARPPRRDLLQVALEIWRHGGVGRPAAEGAGGREREAQEDAGGADDGCRDAERDAWKKLLRPGSRRKAVDWAMREKSYSQRRACALDVVFHGRILVEQRKAALEDRPRVGV